jgi:hypothetical protein
VTTPTRVDLIAYGRKCVIARNHPLLSVRQRMLL